MAAGKGRSKISKEATLKGKAVAFLLAVVASAGLPAFGLYRAVFAGVLPNGALL
jgi:hypothetical protein